MSPKKHDVLAAELVSMYGCKACKHQNVDDAFLCSHSRFWCLKQKTSFGEADGAYLECQDWTFSGNEEMVKSLHEPRLPE